LLPQTEGNESVTMLGVLVLLFLLPASSTTSYSLSSLAKRSTIEGERANERTFPLYYVALHLRSQGQHKLSQDAAIERPPDEDMTERHLLVGSNQAESSSLFDLGLLFVSSNKSNKFVALLTNKCARCMPKVLFLGCPAMTQPHGSPFYLQTSNLGGETGTRTYFRKWPCPRDIRSTINDKHLLAKLRKWRWNASKKMKNRRAGDEPEDGPPYLETGLRDDSTASVGMQWLMLMAILFPTTLAPFLGAMDLDGWWK
jgi:hypothetical protein